MFLRIYSLHFFDERLRWECILSKVSPIVKCLTRFCIGILIDWICEYRPLAFTKTTFEIVKSITRCFFSHVNVSSRQFILLEEVLKLMVFGWLLRVGIAFARNRLGFPTVLIYIETQTLVSPPSPTWFFAPKLRFKVFYVWWDMRLKTNCFFLPLDY